MEPYYQDDHSLIYHGDCREILATFHDQDACITVTSPPYNMGLTPGGNGRGMYGHTTSKANRFTTSGYDGHSDAMDPDEYDEMLRFTLAEMWRISIQAVFWNHRPRIIHGVGHDPLDGVFPIPYRQRIILARPTGIDVGLKHFATRQEHLYLFAHDEWRLTDHAASGLGDVWPTPIVTDSAHPAPFDISVPNRCISSTDDVHVVFDPFMGSGTTLVSAKANGVVGIGIERSERFCEMAANRLAQGVLPIGAT